MELSDFIVTELDRVNQAFTRVLTGMSQEEVAWQPNPEANSIALIVLHSARSEDMFVQGRIQQKPQVWETGKWFEKMGCPQTETGSGYTAEQLACFKAPDIKTIMAYFDAVRAATKQYVAGITPKEYDRIINIPGRLGDMSIASLLALTVIHESQHAGEISYIRGLKRGMNK
jgi:hypothetical protein